MTLTREQVRRAALACVGIPWRHQGRTRRGVDCVGLIYLMADEMGVMPEGVTVPAYRRDPNGEVRGYFDKYLTPLSLTQVNVGSILLHSFRGTPFHASVMLDPATGTIVHGYARHRRVVVDTFKGTKDGMRLHAVYDFPGIPHG